MMMMMHVNNIIMVVKRKRKRTCGAPKHHETLLPLPFHLSLSLSLSLYLNIKYLLWLGRDKVDDREGKVACIHTICMNEPGVDQDLS